VVQDAFPVSAESVDIRVDLPRTDEVFRSTHPAKIKTASRSLRLVCVFGFTLVALFLVFAWLSTQWRPGLVLLFRWFANSVRVCTPPVSSKEPSLSDQPLRIALLSFHDRGVRADYETIGRTTEHRLRQYAQRHGYEVHVHSKPIPSPDSILRMASWNKVLMAIRYLSSYDWIMWIDADALVMNLDVRVEDLVAAAQPGQDLILTHDSRGINAGVWLMRNSSWSHAFLHTWYHSAGPWAHPMTHDKRIRSSGDQHMLQHLLAERHVPKSLQLVDKSVILENQKHVIFYPQCAFNSYIRNHGWMHNYADGDFVLHLAGLKPSRKKCLAEKLQNSTAGTTAVWRNQRFEPLDYPCF